ncbi:MAG: precorrin-2 C(20)-methyltransferase, partial [Megasphaera micronuciformis]
KNAEIIEAYLDKGEDAALFTLGCPTVYASCSYVERRVALAGYDTQIVPGVTSFCAAAAALGTSLCEKDEPLLVVPANRNDLADLLDVPGNTIIMKPSSANDKIRPLLEKKGLISMASMVQQCGTKEEKILFTLEGTVPHSYFSVILVKKEESI